MPNEHFQNLLKQDLSQIAENIAPVLSDFPSHFPDVEAVFGHINQHGCFPTSQKVDSAGLGRDILARFGQIVGKTRQAVQEFSGFRVVYKYESENPSGSHYDRANGPLFAKHLPKILAGQALVDVSSGSSAASQALYAWLLGARFEVYMPESPFKLRPAIAKALGAAVISTPEGEGVNGASRAFSQRLPANPRDLTQKDFWPLNHSQTDLTLPPVGQIADEVISTTRRVDHAIMVYGNGTFMRAVGERLPKETTVWGVRYADSGSQRLLMPGNDRTGVDFPHHQKYQPHKHLDLPLDEVEAWRQDSKRKHSYGLTTAAVRVAALKLISEGYIKPGQSVLLPVYEPGERCETFE